MESKMGEDFIEKILNSMMNSDEYIDNYERYFDIQTFRMLMDKFRIIHFLNNFDISKDDYSIYFKWVIKKYDKQKHKEYKKQLKNYEIDYELHQFINRELIFESIYECDYYQTEYQKMKIIGMLNFFFDTFGYENFITETSISLEDYERYFKSNVEEYKPYKHKKIMNDLTSE